MKERAEQERNDAGVPTERDLLRAVLDESSTTLPSRFVTNGNTIAQAASRLLQEREDHGGREHALSVYVTPEYTFLPNIKNIVEGDETSTRNPERMNLLWMVKNRRNIASINGKVKRGIMHVHPEVQRVSGNITDAIPLFRHMLEQFNPMPLPSPEDIKLTAEQGSFGFMFNDKYGFFYVRHSSQFAEKPSRDLYQESADYTKSVKALVEGCREAFDTKGKAISPQLALVLKEIFKGPSSASETPTNLWVDCLRAIEQSTQQGREEIAFNPLIMGDLMMLRNYARDRGVAVYITARQENGPMLFENIDTLGRYALDRLGVK